MITALKPPFISRSTDTHRLTQLLQAALARPAAWDLFAREAKRLLPEDVYEALATLRTERPPAALLIQSAFDVTDVGGSSPGKLLGNPTPPSHPALVTATIMAANGERPLQLQGYAEGQAFHNIVSSAAGRLAQPSSRALGPHTDLPHGYLPSEEPQLDRSPAPSTVYLACLSSDGVTTTHVTSTTRVLARLASEHITLLQDRAYSCRPPTLSAIKGVAIGRACLIRDSEVLYFRLSPNLILPATTRHQSALEAALRVAATEMEQIVLRPGDVLAINNFSSVHARSNPAEGAAAGGTLRWLLRAYAVSA